VICSGPVQETVPLAGDDEKMKRELFALLTVSALAGCDRTTRTGEIIDQYNIAQCVPVTSISQARRWDYQMRTDKDLIQVFGMAIPGGNIRLKYASDGRQEIAADPGDYIYPADVRLDRGNERLYVKASGSPAGFGGDQSWLFEYDLSQRHQVKRVRVDPSVLAKQCPISN
jgi:hypothetical protein